MSKTGPNAVFRAQAAFFRDRDQRINAAVEWFRASVVSAEREGHDPRRTRTVLMVSSTITESRSQDMCLI